MNSTELSTRRSRFRYAASIIRVVSADVQARRWKSFLTSFREAVWANRSMYFRPEEVIEDVFDILAELGYKPFDKVAESWHRLTNNDALIIAAIIDGSQTRVLLQGISCSKELLKFLTLMGIQVYKFKDTHQYLLVDPDETLERSLYSQYFPRDYGTIEDWREVKFDD